MNKRDGPSWPRDVEGNSGHRNLFGPETSTIGFQLGVQQPIIREKLYVVVEGISGRHTLGSTTLGDLDIFQSIGCYLWATCLRIPAARPSIHSSRNSLMSLRSEVTGKCWGM